MAKSQGSWPLSDQLAMIVRLDWSVQHHRRSAHRPPPRGSLLRHWNARSWRLGPFAMGTRLRSLQLGWLGLDHELVASRTCRPLRPRDPSRRDRVADRRLPPPRPALSRKTLSSLILWWGCFRMKRRWLSVHPTHPRPPSLQRLAHPGEQSEAMAERQGSLEGRSYRLPAKRLIDPS